MGLDEAEVRDRVERVESLLEKAEGLATADGRDTTMSLVQALVDLYGEGLARILDHALDAAGAEAEDDLATRLAADDLVSHLLFLHDLHPRRIETRVTGALDEVRPYLESHGGDVELLGVAEGVARLRLKGSCDGCPSSVTTLRMTVEDAVRKAAPELLEVEAEGADGSGSAAPEPAGEPPGAGAGAARAGPSLPVLGAPGPDGGGGAGSAGRPASGRGREPGAGGRDPNWTGVGSLAGLGGGEMDRRRVGGVDLIFLNLDSTFYAYGPTCPSCAEPLERGALADGEITCGGCGLRYDGRGAGRCLDAPDLHLKPVPLLVTDEGRVRVALGAAAGAA